MRPDAIPAQVEQFIVENIGSVAELEVLLLLHKHASRDWSAVEVAEELRIDRDWTTRRLEELRAQAFLSCHGGSPARYRYDGRPPEQDALVAQLAQCYERRRVSVVTLIYSKPKDHIRSFADAFRLREDK